MYDDFERRFDYTLKGDFKRWFERIEDTDVWGWCKAQEYAAQHRLHLTAFGVGMLAFLAGFGICWLVFVR